MKYIKYVAGLAIVSIALTFYYSFHFDNFHEVVKGRIYRSAQLDSEKLQRYIDTYEFKTIINLLGKSEGECYSDEKEIADANKVELHDFHFSPSKLPGITNLHSLLEALVNAKRPLLIHCQAGADRSGMASAIALSFEENPPLPELKKQFSLKYLVIPLTDSVGPLLFDIYEEWLNSHGEKHDRENLLHWINKLYVDYKQNLEYYIDTVQGKIFEKIGSTDEAAVYLERGLGKISMTGWSFDGRSRLPIEDLYVVIDNENVDKVEYKYHRPDVVEYFNLDQHYYKTVKLGWLSEFDSNILSTGCHTISLRIAKDEGTIIDIETEFKLCVEE